MRSTVVVAGTGPVFQFLHIPDAKDLASFGVGNPGFSDTLLKTRAVSSKAKDHEIDRCETQHSCQPPG